MLPDYVCDSAGIYGGVVFRDHRYQQAKVRLLIELISEQLKRLFWTATVQAHGDGRVMGRGGAYYTGSGGWFFGPRSRPKTPRHRPLARIRRMPENSYRG